MKKFIACFGILLLTALGAQAANIYEEHFVGTGGDQPTNWWDETQDSGYNAHIAFSYTSSMAAVTRTAESTWGKVLSPAQTVNTATYPMIEIVVSGVSASTSWKLGIQEQEGSYGHWDLSGSQTGSGTFFYNYASTTGWSSGTHVFSVEIIVEGAGGTYVVVDSIRIYDVSGTPTFTPTPGAPPSNFWLEHFVGTGGDQPTNWWDETQDSGYNAHIAYSYTSSMAAVTRTAESSWGKVLSPAQTVNTATYPMIEIVVSGVSASTSWKLGIQEQEGSYGHWDLSGSQTGSGTFFYNYASATGWSSGTHVFSVEIIIEGAGGTYAVVDSIRIYGNPGTATFTPTITPTPTPGAPPSNFWLEHFTGTGGDQPTNWWDETQDSGYNAHIAFSYTSSMAAVTRTAESTWGKVLSPAQTVNTATYPMIEIVVSGVSASTSWKLGIQEQEGSYGHWDLSGSQTGSGTFFYNYASTTGWSSGTHVFSVEIIVEGAGGTYAVVDSVRIYGNPGTATFTPTVTRTPTITPTRTPTSSMTVTDTPDIVNTRTFTPTVSVTRTITRTFTTTPTVTPGTGTYNAWEDHFTGGTAPSQPAGWADETQNSTYNAHIAYSYTVSWAAVTRTAESTWGKVLSQNLTIDTALFPSVEVVVNGVSAGAQWKIGIQEQEGSYAYQDLNVSNNSTGLFQFDYASVMGWSSGTHVFSVQLAVEGSAGEYITVDSVRVYGTTPPPTATPTPTASPIIPTYNFWLDHFVGTAGQQPTGWVDETQYPAFNLEIAHSSTASWAAVTRNADSTWGKVLSQNLVVDTAVYPNVEVVVTGVSAGAQWKITIQEQEGSYNFYDLNSETNATGTFNFNYAATAGWSSGTHVFSVQLTVVGAAGSYITVDSVRVYGTTPPPSATPTPTASPIIPTYNFWLEEFAGTAPNQPDGWTDETQNAAFNAEIAYAYTDSWAAVTRNADSTWGKVLSPNLTVDAGIYPSIEVVVTGVSASAQWKIGIQEQEGGFAYMDLNTDTNATGTFAFDYATAMGWSGGTHIFSVQLAIVGPAGAYIAIDSIRIYGTMNASPTPSATITPTSTATPWVAKNDFLAYPNPARDQVMVGYTANGPVTATLDIYRMTGERVATVKEQAVGSPGQVLTMAWNATQVAPGIYFCRLVVTDDRGLQVVNQVKKVAIVK